MRFVCVGILNYNGLHLFQSASTGVPAPAEGSLSGGGGIGE